MQPCRKIWRQSWRCFSLATRVSYPVEVKMKAIEMRLAGIPVKEVMEQLGIRNKTQKLVGLQLLRQLLLLRDDRQRPFRENVIMRLRLLETRSRLRVDQTDEKLHVPARMMLQFLDLLRVAAAIALFELLQLVDRCQLLDEHLLRL